MSYDRIKRQRERRAEQRASDPEGYAQKDRARRAETRLRQAAAHAARNEAFRADLEHPRHGTATGYQNYGCRCSACGAWWREYKKTREQ